MDRIIMKNMSFYGYHGVMNEENRLGQKFIISLEIFVDLEKAGRSDSVEDTVSYAEVYTMVKKHAEEKRYKLIEALAQSIADEALTGFPTIREVVVQVQKPEAPVPGIFEYMAVEIRRPRI